MTINDSRIIDDVPLTHGQLEEWQGTLADCGGDPRLADELWALGHVHDGRRWIPFEHFAFLEADNEFASQLEREHGVPSPTNHIRWNPAPPFGLGQIEADAADRYRKGSDRPLLRAEEIRCCIRDCETWLPLFHRGADVGLSSCPRHGIRMSASPTYVYGSCWRNFLVRIDLARELKKVESWRLGNERSEDAVSWNVFLSLAELGALGSLVEMLTGINAADEPELYVWGNGIYGARRLEEELERTRHNLEAGMGIPTEPDVMLRVPGRAVVLVEAKLGSPNGTLRGKNLRFGSTEAFLARYRAAEGRVDPLARQWIKQREAHEVLEQLCRNVVFAQHLAEPGERPFVVNLVREHAERDIERRLAPHLASARPVQFRRATWEQIYNLPVVSSDGAAPLRNYLQNKTVNLAKAFNV